MSWRNHVYLSEDLDPQIKANLEKTLDEFWSTSEGQEAIINAAEKANNGFLFIGPADFGTANKDGLILLPEGFNGRYQGNDAQMHDISLQRFLFHEIAHIDTGKFRPHQESHMIRRTNRFMEKYYGEEPRHPKAHGNFGEDRIDRNGTEEWDFNENFQSQGAQLQQPDADNILKDGIKCSISLKGSFEYALARTSLDSEHQVEVAVDNAQNLKLDTLTI